MRLAYGEKSFLKKALTALKNGDGLVLSFYRKDAKYLAQCMPILKEIESYYHGNKQSNIAWWRYLQTFLLLTNRFSKFMVIFWLAVANRKRLDVLKDDDGIIEIEFCAADNN